MIIITVLLLICTRRFGYADYVAAELLYRLTGV